MKYFLTVRPQAKTELLAVIDWYESRRSGLGARFGEIVELTFDELIEGPERWPIWREGHPYRRRLIAHFPYVIFYRVMGEEVRIVAVAHTSRRPGYWTQR